MTRQEDWQMSADQQFCFELLSDCFGGAHHVPRLRKCGHGIKVAVYSGALSTFDSDLLARLVFLAHDRCVRVEIVSSGSGCVGIILHRRRGRDGPIYQRHPSLDDAIADHRRSFSDHLPYRRKTMTEPSPAASFIVRAFNERYERCGLSDDNWRELCLAAAISALADVLVPHQKPPLLMRGPDLERLCQRQHTRRYMLALVTELETS